MNIFEHVTKRYPNGAAGHLSVLIIWSVLGLAAVFAGQRFPPRFAAGPARNRPEPISPPAGYDPADVSSPVPSAGSGRPQASGLERKSG